MKKFMALVLKADFSLFVVSGTALVFMMLVTLADVVMRSLDRPIVGSIELISFSGSIAIGLAIPYTSWTKGHIYVDFFIEKVSPAVRSALNTITKLMGVILFCLAGYNFVIFGFDLMRTHQVSGAFKLPLYPITFGLAVSCILQALTLVCDLLKDRYGDINE